MAKPQSFDDCKAFELGGDPPMVGCTGWAYGGFCPMRICACFFSGHGWLVLLDIQPRCDRPPRNGFQDPPFRPCQVRGMDRQGWLFH